MIVLPAMPPEQTASWIGVLDLYDRLDEGWTLIGGHSSTCTALNVDSSRCARPTTWTP